MQEVLDRKVRDLLSLPGNATRPSFPDGPLMREGRSFTEDASRDEVHP
jgi:hypothetical protein